MPFLEGHVLVFSETAWKVNTRIQLKTMKPLSNTHSLSLTLYLIFFPHQIPEIATEVLHTYTVKVSSIMYEHLTKKNQVYKNYNSTWPPTFAVKKKNSQLELYFSILVFP